MNKMTITILTCYTSTTRSTCTSTNNNNNKMKNNIPTYTRVILLLVLILLGWASRPIKAHQTFGLEVHHRYSDQVTRILDGGYNQLPEKGSVAYYSTLAHRDVNVINGRRLTSYSGDFHGPLTFLSGNTTYLLRPFGFLHYANVTVGTPGLSFLVALDTGSDLFWLPCDCTKCVKGVPLESGGQVYELVFSIYSLNNSTTGRKVPCNSSICEQNTRCSDFPSMCPYKVMYLSSNTSSSGYLVEDVLHLTADDNPSEPLNAKIPFGCGKVETGSFLDGGAPNGLLGLGLDNLSLPSMLARQNITANSFSMCFREDGLGRITFGDTGSPDQSETPFNHRKLNPHYNISLSKISVGTNVSQVAGLYAIFDTGTSFTFLNDPAYSLIVEKFNAQVKDKRFTSQYELPFEYCYDLSQSPSDLPPINLTMAGGDQFYVTDPILTFSSKTGSAYCLGIVKSENVNIIGQNFMTGYRVVFNRERMVLGWKASNCNEIADSSMLPISPQSSQQVPPISSIEPQATQQNGSPIPGPSSNTRQNLSHLNLWTSLLLFSLHVLSIFR